MGLKAPGNYLDQFWSNKILVSLVEGPKPPKFHDFWIFGEISVLGNSRILDIVLFEIGGKMGTKKP